MKNTSQKVCYIYISTFTHVSNDKFILANPLTNNSTKTTINVQPNPVFSSLDINTNEPCAIHSVKVYDYLGTCHQVVHQPCEKNINVEHLTQGAYIIELMEGANRKIARFVKM